MSDPLLDAANAIDNKSPKIKAYAILQANRTIGDEGASELEYANNQKDFSDLKKAVSDLSQVDIIQNSAIDGLQKTVSDLWLAKGVNDQEINDLNARVQALEALQAPVTPPTPAPSRFGGNGLFSNEQSNFFGTFTAAQNQQFSLILSGSDKSSAFKTQGVKGVIYHTLFEVGVTETSTVWPNAVTEADALSNGWLYLDQSGAPITASGQYFCDPSNPSYQAAWSAKVAAQCALGAVGVFIDNCAPVAWWGTRPYKNGVAVTDAQIGDALMSLFTYFKKTYPNLYLLPNIGTWTQSRVDFCKRAAAAVGGPDGIMIENYTADAVQQSTVQAIQAAGTDPWVIAPDGVTGSSVLAHQYATAFASVYDRLGGGFGLAAPEPVSTNWAGPLA